MSAETFDYHHGKHHRAYVTKLNALTDGKPEAGKSLEELIKTTEGVLFDQAAQAWNHTFFWGSMKPGGGGAPSGDLAAAIDRDFGGLDSLKAAFSNAAATRFGSGWAWLVVEGGQLAVMSTANAGNPMTEGKTPILTLDVWEHAYYLDYRNARLEFIAAFLEHLIDWDFGAANFSKA